MSPVTHISPDDPPTLLLHGDNDQTVPVAQAEIPHRALQQNGVTNHHIIFPAARHSFQGEDATRATQANGRLVHDASERKDGRPIVEVR